MNTKLILFISTLLISSIINASLTPPPGNLANWKAALDRVGIDNVTYNKYTNGRTYMSGVSSDEATAVTKFISSNKRDFTTSFSDTDVSTAVTYFKNGGTVSGGTLTVDGATHANWATVFTRVLGISSGAYTVPATLPINPYNSGTEAQLHTDTQALINYLTSRTDTTVASALSNKGITVTWPSANSGRNATADATAATLKSQIQSSITTYNQYATANSKPTITQIP